MFDIAQIHRPASLAEALRLAARHPRAVIIAGGTDVLIQVREGKLANSELLSIHGLSELSGVSLGEHGEIMIGPLTSFAELERHQLIERHIPILAQAAGTVGGPQIRSMGTVGGNVANGVTSADTASSLQVLQAELLLQSIEGQRLLPIREFYLGPGKTARREGEILTKIIIRRDNYDGAGGCYLKYAMREAMDIATLGCAALVKPDKRAQTIEWTRLAFGVAAPVPLRLYAAEQALAGLSVDQARDKLPELVRAEIKPRDSWRASRAFRLHIAGVLAERALQAAWQQAISTGLVK